MSAHLAPRDLAVLDAVQEAFFPDGGELLPGGASHLGRRLEEFFAEAKPVMRFAVRMLLLVLELSPLLHHRARFSRLPCDARITWLRRLMASPRPGIRALALIPKLLAQIVVYDDPAFLRAEGLPDPCGPAGGAVGG